jgi:hypothetical protein
MPKNQKKEQIGEYSEVQTAPYVPDGDNLIEETNFSGTVLTRYEDTASDDESP